MAGALIAEKYSERAAFVQRDAGNVPGHTKKTGGRRQRREGTEKGDKENEQKRIGKSHGSQTREDHPGSGEMGECYA